MLVVKRDLHPDVFESVWNLAEESVNGFEAVGQHLMNPVFDGVAVAEVGNPDFASSLADTLDAAFALFETGWVPRKIDIDERTQTLKVESLGGGVGPQQELQLTGSDAAFENIPVAALEFSISPKAGPVTSRVEPDVYPGKL